MVRGRVLTSYYAILHDWLGSQYVVLPRHVGPIARIESMGSDG